MAIATAAKQIMCDGMQVVVAGGQENISAVQTRYFEWTRADQDPNVLAVQPAAYMPMLETAEFVSRKYGITRDVQDQYALDSQLRTAAAQGRPLLERNRPDHDTDAGRRQSDRRNVAEGGHAHAG